MGEPDASLWFRPVDRDRRILALLAEHKVLATGQIAAVEFASVRRAQKPPTSRAYAERTVRTMTEPTGSVEDGTAEVVVVARFVPSATACVPGVSWWPVFPV
jgi:hypothetical protein